MTVQEIHGIFQFSDDLFLSESLKENWIAPDYSPKILFPQWYNNGEEEEDNSLLIVKHRIDWLYFTGNYKEACKVGEAFLERSPNGVTRREIYEALLVCSTRANNKSLAIRMLRHLESLKVEDSGLLHVCSKARKDLEKEKEEEEEEEDHH